MRVLFVTVPVLLLAILVSASDVNPIWLSPTDSSQGDHAEEFPEQGVWSNISIGAGSRADVPIVVMDSKKTLWIMFGNRGFNGDPLMTVWNYDPKADLYRWVAGPGNDTTYLRNPGELRVPSKDNYPGGVNWNRGTIDHNDNIWFFSSNECCELWMFNTTSFMFTRMSGESGVTNVPSFGSTPSLPGDDVYPGDNSGGCFVTDSQNNLWLVSGAVSNKFLDFVWHFNTSSLQWRYVSGNATEFHTTYGDTPVYGGRWLSACDIDENDRVWLFGGTGSLRNPYSDVWSFDTRSAQWQLEHGSDATYANKATIISPDFAAGNIPNARENAALVDRKDGTLLLFAGSGNITASGSWYGFNDVWLFNKTSKMWKHVSGDPFTTNLRGNYSNYREPGSVMPGKYYNGVTNGLNLNGEVYTMGGYYDTSAFGHNDIWFIPANRCPTKAADKCDTNAQCTIVDMFSYSCQCNTGFTGDGFTCTAVSVAVPQSSQVPFEDKPPTQSQVPLRSPQSTRVSTGTKNFHPFVSAAVLLVVFAL